MKDRAVEIKWNDPLKDSFGLCENTFFGIMTMSLAPARRTSCDFTLDSKSNEPAGA